MNATEARKSIEYFNEELKDSYDKELAFLLHGIELRIDQRAKLGYSFLTNNLSEYYEFTSSFIAKGNIKITNRYLEILKVDISSFFLKAGFDIAFSNSDFRISWEKE